MGTTNLTSATRPRWRFTIRLSTLFVLITIAAVACNSPRFYRQWQIWQIKKYVNQDLRELPADERRALQELTRKIWPASADIDWGTPANWFIWRIPSDRGIRLVLFEEEEDFFGDDRVHLTLCNDAGDFIRQICISPLDRVGIIDASVSTTVLPGEAIIGLQMMSLHQGLQKHYFAVVNDQVIWVRAETPEGEICFRAWTYDWYDSDKKLSLETWTHQFSDPRDPNVLHAMLRIYEGSSDSSLSVEVQQQLSELSRHRHPWVAEMAKATLKKLPVAGE